MCTLMAGVILILLGVTGLGTAVKYIPRPVVIGFTNGIGVLIASTQVRDLLGLQTSQVPGSSWPACMSLWPARKRRPPQRLCWRCHHRGYPGPATGLGADSRSIVILLAGSAVAFVAQLPVGRSRAASAAFPAAHLRCMCPLPDGLAAALVLAGFHGGNARRHRIAALRGGRRSHVRRSTRPQRGADGSRDGQHCFHRSSAGCLQRAPSRGPRPTFARGHERRLQA